jgi:predicted TIM-barrel fold metal-dependent hydrolase
MIIDSHAHVAIEPAYGLYDTAEKLIARMDEAGVALAAISSYHNAPGRTPDPHAQIIEAVQQYPDRLIGYARIDPWYGEASVSALEDAVSRGLRGLKLHPATYMLYPYDDLTVNVVRRAGELRIPVMIHSGDENMCLPYQIERLAARCPETTLILAHIGGYYAHRAAIDVAERHPHVLVDTSEIPFPDHIRRAVERLGAEKVLFGSDAPCCDIRLELLKVARAGLRPEQNEQILFRNYAALMGVPVQENTPRCD